VKRKRLLLAAVVAVAIGLFLRTFSSSPLPKRAPLEMPLPPARPPAQMSVWKLPTGVTHRSAGFAYRGGSFREPREFAMTAVLVKHPRGDLLIDTGFGRRVDEHFAMMPFFFRAVTSYEKGSPAADQLDAAGYDRKSLRAIVVTHAHWDHVSGIPDFPGTPVWVTADERRFIDGGGFVTGVVRSFDSVRYEEYAFEGGAYLGFAKSHDVYRDGSVVIVPAPGHTPGSVIVFLTLPNGRRYALVGDLAWQREGITLREERPWLQRIFADADADGVEDGLVHMASIAERFPELALVPAHDQRGFEGMATLSR
jgi:N-acyl homoserine lactone hydrolase